jgi:predicted O-methyltransferase YrrM
MSTNKIDYLDELVKQAIQDNKAWEGSADSKEQTYLAKFARDPGIKIIGEIGFNAGISSFTFLAANPNIIIYSFDIAEYCYVEKAKKYIDDCFPGRHNLIIGDSRKTVPEFKNKYPDIKFDLIFIDGSHEYEAAKADLMNMRSYAKQSTVLIIDDLTPWKPWGIGPTKAWQYMNNEGLVRQHELYRDGRPAKSIEPPGERSWASGRYTLS